MPAISNLILNDGLASPVAHTFSVASVAPGVNMFEDRSITQYIGFNRLTTTLSRPSGDSRQATRNIKVSFKLETPKLETTSNSTISGIAPAPTVAYRPFMECTFVLPERSALQDRKDLFAFTKNLLNTTYAQIAVEQLELGW